MICDYFLVKKVVNYNKFSELEVLNAVKPNKRKERNHQKGDGGKLISESDTLGGDGAICAGPKFFLW